MLAADTQHRATGDQQFEVRRRLEQITDGGPAGTTCSKLSSTNNSCLSRR